MSTPHWETLDINPLEIPVMTAKMKWCKYRLGAKAKSLDMQLSDVDAIDCSGFVRLMIYKACGVKIPDGSYNQGKWFEDNNFKVSDTLSCCLNDGVLRLLWMTPTQGNGIGHIAFCLNGRTYESCSGKGPCSKPFSRLSNFQKVAKAFVLAYPVH